MHLNVSDDSGTTSLLVTEFDIGRCSCFSYTERTEDSEQQEQVRGRDAGCETELRGLSVETVFNSSMTN